MSTVVKDVWRGVRFGSQRSQAAREGSLKPRPTVSKWRICKGVRKSVKSESEREGSGRLVERREVMRVNPAG